MAERGIVVFHVLMQKAGMGQGCFQVSVSADSLHEAEQAALQLLCEHFPGRMIVLVHTGALVYEAYGVEKPLAQVHIKVV